MFDPVCDVLSVVFIYNDISLYFFVICLVFSFPNPDPVVLMPKPAVLSPNLNQYGASKIVIYALLLKTYNWTSSADVKTVI